ncbi:MAG: metal-dependent transcriptional regulator [Proteocatella sp.]
MKIQESAENYLETILILQKRKGNVKSIDIVTELNYSKPSISNAMKNLSNEGYIYMDENKFITLTDAGREIAERMYERHQLISKFLMKLGVSEDVALEDACRIEHVISDETFQKIKEHANNMI